MTTAHNTAPLGFPGWGPSARSKSAKPYYDPVPVFSRIVSPIRYQIRDVIDSWGKEVETPHVPVPCANDREIDRIVREIEVLSKVQREIPAHLREILERERALAEHECELAKK